MKTTLFLIGLLSCTVIGCGSRHDNNGGQGRSSPSINGIYTISYQNAAMTKVRVLEAHFHDGNQVDIYTTVFDQGNPTQAYYARESGLFRLENEKVLTRLFASSCGLQEDLRTMTITENHDQIFAVTEIGQLIKFPESGYSQPLKDTTNGVTFVEDTTPGCFHTRSI